MLKFKMEDGSIYTLNNENWIKALEHRCEADGLELHKYIEQYRKKKLHIYTPSRIWRYRYALSLPADN